MRRLTGETARARPSQGLLDRQRGEKARWRRDVVARPFREKVAMVLELQRRLYPILRRRREMQSWERPWRIEP